MAAPHKTKQYLLAPAKVLVLVVTFGYVFYRLQNNPDLNFLEFVNGIRAKGISASYFLFVFLFLAALNWALETLKWKTLASTVHKIAFKTALKQSLASLTVSLATPNRIGEYGAKALFFQKSDRKKILLLNFFSNTAQLAATVLFGIVGMSYFLFNYKVSYSFGAVCFVVIGGIFSVVFVYYFRDKELFLKGFSIANIFKFFQNLPNALKISVVVMSVSRYLIFSFMFFWLLLFFGAETSFITAMALIFSMYFLISIVPTIFIFDVVVRGGVAVWLFSYIGVSDLIVLSTVLAMWIFNFVVPSILGAFYVLTYKPNS